MAKKIVNVDFSNFLSFRQIVEIPETIDFRPYFAIFKRL